MDKSKQVYNRTNFIQGSAKKKTRKVKKKKEYTKNILPNL